MSITKEDAAEMRRRFYGVMADYVDPDFGQPLMQFQGFTQTTTLLRFMHGIRTFPVDSSDVYITTFPKSGTTWMQHIVWYLMTQDFDTEEAISFRIPELELPWPPPCLPENLQQYTERAPPRMVKSHLPIEFLPQDLAKARIIYIYRNPKDVIVSSYHHYRALAPHFYQGTFEQMVDLFCSGRIPFGPWHLQLKSFYNAMKTGSHSILFISYEEMVRDRLGAIKKVAQFVGKEDLPESVLQRVYEATSFEAIKRNDSGNYSWTVDAGLWDKALPPFIRRGQVGDWKNYFTPELEERLNKYLAENMADVDIQFSYE